MKNLNERRLDRAARKATETGIKLTPLEMLEAAQLAHNHGDKFALAGIGFIDEHSMLVKP